MRRVIIYPLIALVTFSAGYLGQRLVNSYADTIVEAVYSGPDPDAPIDFSEYASLPLTPYCDLVHDNSPRSEQMVRVKGTYSFDMENSALGDHACGNNVWTWVEAEPDSNFMRACANLKRNQKADVVFLGRLTGPEEEGVGHLNGYRYRLIVLNVEEMKVLGAEK